MKKLFASIATLVLIYVAAIGITATGITATGITATAAFAKDVVLDATAQSVTVKPDKNGNDYARIIIQEDRELNGIKYKADVMAMCFGTAVEKAKALTAGDKFKAIASENEYRGSTSYRIVSFIQ